MVKHDTKVKDLMRKALEDGRNRNYSAAVSKLRKVLGITDDYPEALLYLGRAYHELGLYDDAVFSFRLFITNSPKSGAGYFYLGRTYIATSKFERAASCFSESIKLKNDFAPSFAYMGYASMRSGSVAEAVKFLGQAVELEPENIRIYNMYINSIMMFSLSEFRNENFESSLEGFLFMEQAGYSSITTVLYTGIILKELNRFQEAVIYISRAEKMSPDDNLIKNILAELYIRVSRIDDALQLLQTYMDSNEIKSFINTIDNIERSLAVSYWEKENYRAALHFALTSLRKERTADMHLLAGECLKESGRLDEASNHYSRAMEINSHSVEPLYGKAVIFWMQQDYQTMMNILKKIKRINPDDDFAAYYTVLCCSELGFPYSDWKPELAALKERESDPWLLTAGAFGELTTGNNKQAVALFRKALGINDNPKRTWEGLMSAIEQGPSSEKRLMTVLKKYLVKFSSDNLNRVKYINLLIKNESYASAAEQYRILVSSSKPETSMLVGYAFCCRKAGKYKDAALLYRQILSNDPYNENYLKMLLYCMRKDGRDLETIPLLEHAVLEFKKPSLELLLVYGTTLYRNNMEEKALNVFQKCIYDGYNDWRIFRNMGIIYRNRGLGDWSGMYLDKADKLKKTKKN